MISLRISGAASCGLLQAVGGVGGSSSSIQMGPGGGGAGGRLLFQKGSGTCSPTGTSVIGANPGIQLDPGAPGGSAYGAQAGSNGAATTLSGGFPTLPAPVIVTPANGSTINNRTYAGTLATTVPAGTQVVVLVDGVEVGLSAPDASGNWTFTALAALSDGPHSVKSYAVNTSQAVSSVDSNTNSFTVDSTPPAAATVITPASGSSTSDSTPTYSGTSDVNTSIDVIVDGSSVATVSAVGSNWSFTPTTPLTDGSHTVTARATDLAGNTGATGSVDTFTVDATPPTAPSILEPANGSSISDNTPTISGTAEANTSVLVRVDGADAGTTTANGTGLWSYTSTTSLSDGAHTVNARATDSAGNEGAFSTTNTFTIDTVAPPAPVVAAQADGSVTTTTTPTLSGTAEANATIAVSVDSAQVGTATANNAGDWVYVLTTPLSEGVHTVSATAADAAGNTSPQSNVNSFTVDSIAPLAPVILAPAQMGFSSNPTPTYSGTAEALVSIDISVDGSSIGTTTAGADGTWELLQASALSEGAHTVEATAEDAVGRTSPSSALVAFTVDTVAPNVVIDSAPPSETTDRSANVSFSADEEGVSFECSVDAEPFAPCTSPRSLSALSDGAHSFAVRATDLAQNVDPSPASVTWTVITREMTDPVGPSGMEEQPSEEESTPGARGCGGCSSTANDSGSMFVTALLVLSLRRRLRRTSARSAS